MISRAGIRQPPDVQLLFWDSQPVRIDVKSLRFLFGLFQIKDDFA